VVLFCFRLSGGRWDAEDEVCICILFIFSVREAQVLSCDGREHLRLFWSASRLRIKLNMFVLSDAIRYAFVLGFEPSRVNSYT